MQPKLRFFSDPRHRSGSSIALTLSMLLGSYAPLAVAQTTPELSVTVTGRHQQLDGLPTDSAVFVQLGVSPRTNSSGQASDSTVEVLPVQVESEQEVTPYGDVPLDPLERDDATSMAPARSESRRLRDGKTQEELEIPRDAFVLSPAFVRQAVAAALHAQGVHASLERLESLSGRARTSSLLPEVRFRAGRSVDQSLRLAPTTDDPYRYTQTGGVSFILEGAATFRLNRLLFANEELGIERLKLAQARERQRLQDSLLDELFVWHKAFLAASSRSPAGNQARLRLRESSLRLDVLTGGWFSEHEPALEPEPNPTPAQGELEGQSPTEAGPGTLPAQESMPKKRPTRKLPSVARVLESPGFESVLVGLSTSR